MAAKCFNTLNIHLHVHTYTHMQIHTHTHDILHPYTYIATHFNAYTQVHTRYFIFVQILHVNNGSKGSEIKILLIYLYPKMI